MTWNPYTDRIAAALDAAAALLREWAKDAEAAKQPNAQWTINRAAEEMDRRRDARIVAKTRKTTPEIIA